MKAIEKVRMPSKLQDSIEEMRKDARVVKALKLFDAYLSRVTDFNDFSLFETIFAEAIKDVDSEDGQEILKEMRRIICFENIVLFDEVYKGRKFEWYRVETQEDRSDYDEKRYIIRYKASNIDECAVYANAYLIYNFCHNGWSYMGEENRYKNQVSKTHYAEGKGFMFIDKLMMCILHIESMLCYVIVERIRQEDYDERGVARKKNPYAIMEYTQKDEYVAPVKPAVPVVNVHSIERETAKATLFKVIAKNTMTGDAKLISIWLPKSTFTMKDCSMKLDGFNVIKTLTVKETMMTAKQDEIKQDGFMFV